MFTYTIRIYCKKAVAFLMASTLLLSTRSQAAESYNDMIELEQEKHSKKIRNEKIASGLAGLVIGLYGYYNDERGILSKILYSATQTAGAYTIGEAIELHYEPSIYMTTDKYIQEFESSSNLDTMAFRRDLLESKNDKLRAKEHRVAYTSAILSVIYLYNGFRESEKNQAIRDVNFFLGANATLISAATFYRINKNSKLGKTSFEVDVFPDVRLTVRF